MRTSKLVKGIVVHLPILAVMLIAVTGMFVVKELYPPAPDFRVGAITQFLAEPANPQVLLAPGTVGRCLSPLIYTSLPPKCRTASGAFVPMDGFPANVFVAPAGK